MNNNKYFFVYELMGNSGVAKPHTHTFVSFGCLRNLFDVIFRNELFLRAMKKST